jgi:hypothetical protein
MIADRERAETCCNKELAAEELKSLYNKALQLYGVRILDNLDLDRFPDLKTRAVVAARAMIDRGDARAFAMGREMLDRAKGL